jgi:hypothetical protein
MLTCCDASSGRDYLLQIEHRDSEGNPVDAIFIRLEPFLSPRYVSVSDRQGPLLKFQVSFGVDGAIRVLEEFSGRLLSPDEMVDQALQPVSSAIRTEEKRA